MRVTLYSIGIVVVAAMMAIAGISAQKAPAAAPTLSKQTQENLATAMHGEAFAYAKYMLYAQHARMHGDRQLAMLFTQAARTERFQHFSEEAALAGLVRTDKDNLKDAVAGESYEVETMYREFAEQATAAGDKAAADRFDEIRRDEMGHRDAFKAALDKPEVKSVSSN